MLGTKMVQDGFGMAGKDISINPSFISLPHTRSFQVIPASILIMIDSAFLSTIQM